MPNIIIRRRILATSSGYKFINSKALTFWNALTIANGGAEVSGSLYGISTTVLKTVVDNFFITGNSNGWLSSMIIMTLYIGGTANTHAVNAINPGTYNLSYVNSPTHGKNGMTTNGTNNYAKCGNNPSTEGITTASAAYCVLTKNATAAGGTNKTYMGGRNGITQGMQLGVQAATTFWFFDAHNTTTGRALSANTTLNQVTIGSRISATDEEIYVNGSSVFTLGTSGGTLSTLETYIGCLNSNGTAATFNSADYIFSCEGLGLTSSNVSSLTTAITTLQTILGR